MTLETAASQPRPFWVRALLWVIAFLLAALAMVYQRATGPTYPLKRTFTLDLAEPFARIREVGKPKDEVST